jgi:uncharacterized protein YdeI (YjbR/CyaY-like superfamily)
VRFSPQNGWKVPQLVFQGRLQADQGAYFIRVPAEVIDQLGQAKRGPIAVTINGQTFQTSVAVHRGRHYLSIRPDLREAAGISAGDAVNVGLDYEAEVRVADLPADLKAALEARPGAVAAFEALPYTYKKDLVSWVMEAKQSDTRQRRIAQGLRMLLRGRPRNA